MTLLKMAAVAETSDPAPTASERVRNEWLRRVEAEYRSAAFAQHLTLWLIQIGAPVELVHDGLAIVADELRHARLSFDVFTAAGGQGGPQLVQETLQLPRTSAPLEHDLFVCNLNTFVVGETVAVRLFKRLRELCEVPVARMALDTILVDEVRHREFGWTVLDWMLSSPNEAMYRSLANQEVPAALRQREQLYAQLADEPGSTALSKEDRTWGLMPRSDYRQAFALCLQNDYRPRFTQLGIAVGL